MKSLLRFVPLLACGLSLASCVGVPSEEPPSAYGAFLAARYAGVNRDADGAATYYAEALHRAPGNATLADRAYITALLAGNMDEAVIYADQAIEAGDPSRLAGLYRAADHIAGRRYGRALTLLQSAPDYGPFNAFSADLMAHWAMLGGGHQDEALAAAREMAAPGYLGPFVSLHRAMLFEAAGEYESADAGYQATLYASPFQRMVTNLYGSFLERRGRRAEAIALYQRYLEVTPGDASILESLERARSPGRPPREPSVSQFAALSLFGPSASLAAQADMDLTVLYLRMIQRMHPEYAPNRMLLGETLQRIRLPEVALAEYRAVEPGPLWLSAQIDLIWLTARLDDLDGATALAQSLIETSGDDEARLILADLYRVQSRCPDAAELYAEVIRNREARQAPVDWRYHYFRASCLYALGELDAAEADFLRALELGPDEAQVLNDLGYLWLDRGERLEEAFQMVERAAVLEPEQGHIIDSLGWAYYRLGDYDHAVRELERAVSLSPGNATANFHLGDAYWQVGRRLEARFQWERTLTLDPDEEEAAALDERLAHGLPVGEETEIAGRQAEPVTP